MRDLSRRSYPPFQGRCTPNQFVKPVHQQWKRFLSCMPAAVDELHGGDVGLAAKAAATRGSRPYGLSPPLRGIEVHMDSPPKILTTRLHGSVRGDSSIAMNITLSLVFPLVGLVLLLAAGSSRRTPIPTTMFHLPRRSLSLVGLLGT